MKFDWSTFTEVDYNKYMEKRMAKIFDSHNYIGAVHIGDISIDLIDCGEENLLVYDFYVAHEDTGYGYKNDILPYDYADGDAMNVPYNLPYEEFKSKTEKLFVEYIKNYKGAYSLVEHANRPLENW